MFLSLLPFIAIAVLCMVTAFLLLRNQPRRAGGEFVGRHRTRDISFLAQSPIGFIGRITRSTPLPRAKGEVNDATNPVAYYGLAVLNTVNNTVRSIIASDGAGVSARLLGIASASFPFQPSSATNYGAQSLQALTAVAPNQLIDVLRQGFLSVYLNSAQAPTATMADPVHIWCAANSGTHIQGGFENAPAATVASAVKGGGNTGTGTVSAGPTVNAAMAQAGAYTVTFTAATVFNVIDPNGRQLQPGATGVAYSDGGIGFTITAGGTPFVAGDGFTETVTMQTVPVPDAYFAGPGDSTGATELAFNL